MATLKTDGIDQLIIDELARDAQLIGAPEAEGIQVSPRISDEPGSPAYSTEERLARLTGGPAVRVLAPERLAVTVKRCQGDLRVLGFCGDVNLEEVSGSLRIAELAGHTLVGDVRGDFRADHVADLRVLGSCTGDMRLEKAGRLSVEKVSGDVRMISVQDASLGRVMGDLWMESIGGAAKLGEIEGDVRLTAIGGDASLQEVAGDLRAQALSGGLTAPKVHGSVALQGPFAPGKEYVISAAGDISIQLDASADVQLRVTAQGRVRSALDLTPAADGSATFTASSGRGGARINLTSGGDVTIRQHGREEAVKQPREAFHGLGDQIRQQVRASLAAAGVTGTSGAWGEYGRHARAAKGTSAPAAGRAPAKGPKRDEEMMILSMVERGLLSPEDADRLLQALE